MQNGKSTTPSFFRGMSLNRKAPLPLYYQLKEILLEYANNHHPDPEKPIPTELMLSTHFGISRPTVRQAVKELAAEGYLRRIRGKGTFVLEPKISQSCLQSFGSFDPEMVKKHLLPATRIIEAGIVPSNEMVSKALEIEPGSDIVKLRRLHCVKDEPVAEVLTYVPAEKCPNLISKVLEKESLLEILEKDYALVIRNAVYSLEASAAGRYEARLLEIAEGAPIQLFESVTYLDDGSPIEYSQAKYRGDRNRFTVEQKRN